MVLLPYAFWHLSATLGLPPTNCGTLNRWGHSIVSTVCCIINAVILLMWFVIAAVLLLASTGAAAGTCGC